MSTTVTELAVSAKTDPAHLEPLWLAVHRLIIFWAKRYPRPANGCSYDVDDLVQSGYLALVDAVQGYDPDKGKFTVYLRYFVRLHFADVAGVRTSKQRPENHATSLDAPLAGDGDTTRKELLEDTTAHYVYDDFVDRESARQDCAGLMVEVDKLSELMKQAVMLTVWEDMPFNAAADVMGVPADCVQQQRNKALRALMNTRAGRIVTRNHYHGEQIRA